MEYVFGTKGAVEILKVKGPAHARLTGFQQLRREYPDQTIFDDFRIVCLMDSAEDDEGNCYDWYEIDHHYRTSDKTPPLAAALEETRITLEDALCEQDSIMTDRLADIENAMCEQDLAVTEQLALIEDALCELDKG